MRKQVYSVDPDRPPTHRTQTIVNAQRLPFLIEAVLLLIVKSDELALSFLSNTGTPQLRHEAFAHVQASAEESREDVLTIMILCGGVRKYEEVVTKANRLAELYGELTEMEEENLQDTDVCVEVYQEASSLLTDIFHDLPLDDPQGAA